MSKDLLKKPLFWSIVIWIVGWVIIAIINFPYLHQPIRVAWFILWVTFSGLVWTAWETTNLRKQGQKSLDIQTSPIFQLHLRGSKIKLRNQGQSTAFNVLATGLIFHVNKKDAPVFRSLLRSKTEANVTTIAPNGDEVEIAETYLAADNAPINILNGSEYKVMILIRYNDLNGDRFYSIFSLETEKYGESPFYRVKSVLNRERGTIKVSSLLKLL